jgi:tetratricopeptide (TPR) repeat protein
MAEYLTPGYSSVEPESTTDSSGESACMECGRQDETVRVVGIPYVFSLVVLTQQRAYKGVWCRRHHSIKLVLASFLTAFFGWLGIPHGLAATPGTLLKLAKGGVVPGEANARLLKQIASIKIARGDIKTASRCLEEALFVHAQDEDASRRLSDVYRKYASSLAQSPLSDLFPTLIVILAAVAMGGVIGILDYLITKLLNFTGNVDFLGVIISWLPLVGMLGFGGIMLARLLEFELKRMNVRQRLFGVVLAAFSALLAVYSVVTGFGLADFMDSLISGTHYGSIPETLMKAGSVLTRGGAWILSDLLASGDVWDQIYIAIIALGLVFCLVSNISVADCVIRWKQQLYPLRPQPTVQEGGLSLVHWGVLLAAVLVLGASVTLFSDASPAMWMGTEYLDTLDRGDVLFDAGDLDGAARVYQEAIDLNPDDPWGQVYLGWTYYHQGEYIKAESAFVAALDVDADLEDAQLGYAFVEIALRNYDEAVQYLDAVIVDADDDVNRAEAYSGLSDIHFARGEDEQGLADLETAISLNAENAFYYSDLGFYYFSREKFAEAADAFSNSLDIEPELLDSIFGMGYSLFALEEYEMAAEQLELLLEEDLDEYIALDVAFGLGRCMTELMRPSEAIEYYESILEIDPSNEIAWSFLLLAHSQLADFEKVLELSEMYIDSYPESTGVYTMRVVAGYMLDQPSVVEDALTGAMNAQGEDAYNMFYIASAFSTLQRFSEAEALLIEASQLIPDDETIQLSLVYIYTAQKKFDAALASVEDLRAITGETADVNLALAGVYIEQGNLEAAEIALADAMELEPDNWEVCNDLSYLFIQQERYEEAVIEAAEALRLNPYSAPANKNLALAAYELGDLETAMQAALESLRLNPKYDVGHYVLGLCYMEQGETESAIREFETFLDLYWDRASVQRYQEAAIAYLEELH